VAILAAVESGCEVVEYTPAEIKRAIVGYGRAEKHQVQQMIKLLLGLSKAPSPHDAADALAIAICHVHSAGVGGAARSGALAARASVPGSPQPRAPRSWRHYRPPAAG
jgi:crossover junction endodeoxyribonuclease RuvC